MEFLVGDLLKWTTPLTLMKMRVDRESNLLILKSFRCHSSSLHFSHWHFWTVGKVKFFIRLVLFLEWLFDVSTSYSKSNILFSLFKISGYFGENFLKTRVVTLQIFLIHSEIIQSSHKCQQLLSTHLKIVSQNFTMINRKL